MPRSSGSSQKRKRAKYDPQNSNRMVPRKRSQPKLAKRQISWLPPCLMSEILSRLPAKSVSRFRSVCKLWNSLSYEPNFLAQMLRNGPDKDKPSVIILNMQSKVEFILRQYEEHKPLCEKLCLMGPRLFPSYVISNSCNGLICILGLENGFLANPATGEVMQLPRGTIGRGATNLPLTAGFGYDVSRAEYKVVRLVHYYDRTVRCEVLTLGSQSWRRLGNAPFQAPFTPPVLVKEALYWNAKHCRHEGPEVAFSFDIRRETFDIIQHPSSGGTHMTGNPRNIISIVGELAGNLCICDKDAWKFQMDIWIMDCNRRRWMIRYRLDLRAMDRLSLDYVRSVRRLAVRDGNILLADGRGRFDYFDPRTGRIRMLMREKKASGFHTLHADSLISPAAVLQGNGLRHGHGNIFAES